MSFESRSNAQSHIGGGEVKAPQASHRRHLSLSQLINETVPTTSDVVVGNLSYDNLDYQANSMTDVTAYLNLNPNESCTSVEADNSTNVKLISSTVEANGAIHLLDSSGRLAGV